MYTSILNIIVIWILIMFEPGKWDSIQTLHVNTPHSRSGTYCVFLVLLGLFSHCALPPTEHTHKNIGWWHGKMLGFILVCSVMFYIFTSYVVMTAWDFELKYGDGSDIADFNSIQFHCRNEKTRLAPKQVVLLRFAVGEIMPNNAEFLEMVQLKVICLNLQPL